MRHSHNGTRSKGALRRLPGEKWVDFNTRQQQAMLKAQNFPKTSRIKGNYRKIADHIDGYDRDDLGLSPDY